MPASKGELQLARARNPSPAIDDSNMASVTNPDHKRVCDISTDAKVVEIRKRDWVTKIQASSDGTLSIDHERVSPEV